MGRLSKKQACELINHNSDGYLNSQVVESLRSWGMRQKDAHLFVAVLAKIDSNPSGTTLESIKNTLLSLGQKNAGR
jgi:hypothetical protein